MKNDTAKLERRVDAMHRAIGYRDEDLREIAFDKILQEAKTADLPHQIEAAVSHGKPRLAMALCEVAASTQTSRSSWAEALMYDLLPDAVESFVREKVGLDDDEGGKIQWSSYFDFWALRCRDGMGDKSPEMVDIRKKSLNDLIGVVGRHVGPVSLCFIASLAGEFDESFMPVLTKQWTANADKYWTKNKDDLAEDKVEGLLMCLNLSPFSNTQSEPFSPLFDAAVSTTWRAVMEQADDNLAAQVSLLVGTYAAVNKESLVYKEAEMFKTVLEDKIGKKMDIKVERDERGWVASVGFKQEAPEDPLATFFKPDNKKHTVH